MANIIYVGSDTYVNLSGLADADTPSTPINSATVNFTLSLDGTNVSGATTVSMPSTGSGGNYQGVLAHTVSLTAGINYLMTITATYSGSQQVKKDVVTAIYST